MPCVPSENLLEHLRITRPGWPSCRQHVGAEPDLPALARRGQCCLRMCGRASSLPAVLLCAPGAREPAHFQGERPVRPYAVSSPPASPLLSCQQTGTPVSLCPDHGQPEALVLSCLTLLTQRWGHSTQWPKSPSFCLEKPGFSSQGSLWRPLTYCWHVSDTCYCSCCPCHSPKLPRPFLP